MRPAYRAYVLDVTALAYATRRAGYRTHAELAAASRVSPSRLDHYFHRRDTNLSASTLLQLADALGCDPRDLMIPADEPREESED